MNAYSKLRITNFIVSALELQLEIDRFLASDRPAELSKFLEASNHIGCAVDVLEKASTPIDKH